MNRLGGLSAIALVLVSAGHIAAPLLAGTPEGVVSPAHEPAPSGLSPAIADLPARVYVPNERSGSVSVIDPETYQVVGRIKVGHHPQHGIYR